jgi:lipopolysaccharide export system permease protein
VLKTLDRYILSQIAKPLLTAMAIGLLMLLAERLVRLLDTTLGKKNSFSVVFEMLAYLVPHYLGIALPAALFIGLLFGFSRLSRDGEIDAVLAAGTGLVRLTRPVLMLSTALALLSVVIVGWLQPITRYAYRAVVFDVGNVEVFYLAQEGVFMQAGSRTFILDKLDRSSNAFEHVFLFDDQGQQGAETLTASKGQLVEVPDQPRPVLRLENGHRLKIEGRQPFGGAGPLSTSSVAEFNVTDTPLGRVTNKVFRSRGDDERELTLPELYLLRDKPPQGATLNSMSAELNKRIVNILTPFVLPLLAIPFALGNRRSLRSYRFVTAIAFVIALYELIEQGALATKATGANPLLSMWLPFGAVSAFAAWRFLATAYSLQSDWVSDAIDAVGDRIASPWRFLFRRFIAGERT